MKILSLNPLGIGEGFERTGLRTSGLKNGLNPLGIGEGFEHIVVDFNSKTVSVLNP